MRPNSKNPNFQNRREEKEFEEKVVQVNRVSKKTKGGNQIGFSVLVVVGDRQGKVGVGLGKAPDVLSSIKKASRKAKKHLIKLPLVNDTIPFPIRIKKGAAIVLLKPAPKGTGVIAGGAVRAVVEAAGVKNIVSKILGTNNQASNVYATFEALKRIQSLANKKGIKLESKTSKKTPISSKEQANLKKNLSAPKSSTPKKPTKAAKSKPKTSSNKKSLAKKTSSIKSTK